MNDLAPQTLSEDQACEIINRWAGGGFFRLRNMGDKIFVTAFKPGSAYTIRLQTQYEERSTARVAAPYTGGPVDNFGQPPPVWTIDVPRPREFEHRDERVSVPHTDRVERCPKCAGEGRVVCSACGGQGQKACPQCGGSGIRHEQAMDMQRDANGNMVQVPRTFEVRCACGNGRVRCDACAGLGLRTCADCAGTGRIKTFEQLLVRFKATLSDKLLDVTPVPDHWFRKLTGEVVVNVKSNQVDRFDPVSADVDRKASELLARSHDVHPDQARVILQSLRIDRIPLNEMDYKYAGVDRKLWICGQEHQIYAPQAPWNRTLFTFLTGAAVLAAVGLIVGVVYLLMR
jgi:hypothetical protein